MTDSPHRVLVPVEILRGESVSEPLIEALASVPVVLLGYHKVPEQTAPGQARMQFEEKARAELEALADAVEAAGGTVATRLVFTHEPMKTFERIAVELECDAVLLLNPATQIERVLVPLRGDVNVEHITELTGALLAGSEAEITLFHVARAAGERDGEPDDRAVDPAEFLGAATHTLIDAGVDADRIERRVVEHDSPIAAIVEAADESDLVVIGESRPSIRDRIFGDPSSTVANRTVNPVLVVRRRILEMDAEEHDERLETIEETADEFDQEQEGEDEPEP